MLVDAALAPDPVRLGAIERAWTQLTGPGVELTATERHQVIKDARAAWDGAAAPNPASGVSGEAAHWLAVDAEGLRSDAITDFETRGLDRWRYLEIVGIVSRLANVDFYIAGLGGQRLQLPAVDHTMPSGRRDAAAVISNMWVPTVGAAYAPRVLVALADELCTGRPSAAAAPRAALVAAAQSPTSLALEEGTHPCLHLLHKPMRPSSCCKT